MPEKRWITTASFILGREKATMGTRTFDISVTVGWLKVHFGRNDLYFYLFFKGLQINDYQIQAVWEAFGLPHQTELQKITPIFDAVHFLKLVSTFFFASHAQQAGHVGLATWNESFGIQDVVVESEEVECYLEIAFWQVRAPLYG